jgi:hypothetical protein
VGAAVVRAGHWLPGLPRSPRQRAVLEGLAEVGYVEGHNVAIEYRLVASAEENEKLPALLRDLIERRVAVLVTVGGTAMALAAKAATQTIPIVFRIGGDPVARGLVPSLGKPGGNVTGTTTLGVELGPKRLEVLSELIPAGATVALFTNARNANAVAETREVQTAATVLGVRLLVLNATSPSELDAVFERIAQQDIHGVLTAADPFIIEQHDRIFALAARRAIPGSIPLALNSQLGASYFTQLPPSTNSVWLATTSVEFSAARSLPTCRCSDPRKSSWRSTSKWQRRSASLFRPPFWHAPTR